MLPECKLIDLLQRIVSDSREHGVSGLSFAAQSALEIVRDLHANYIAPSDIACLGDLINEFAAEGYGDALTYIDTGAVDCEICDALQRRHKS